MKKLRKAFTAIVLVICMSVLMVSPAFAEELTDTFVIPEGQELISRTVTDLGDGYLLTLTVTVSEPEYNSPLVRGIAPDAPTKTITCRWECTTNNAIPVGLMIIRTVFFYETQYKNTGVVDHDVSIVNYDDYNPLRYDGSTETSGNDWPLGTHWTRMTAKCSSVHPFGGRNVHTAWTQIYSDGSVYCR